MDNEEVKDEKSKKKKSKEKAINNVVDLDPKLDEAVKKSAVVTWGRFNPPTIGHSKLIDKVKSVAAASGAVPEVHLTQSQDPKKNPLSYEDKAKLAKLAFGNIVKETKSKTIIELMRELSKKYTDMVLIVGSDRINEFETLLNKYNGREFNFNSIKVISAGDRDPDSDDVSGMSASKMRAAAAAGDIKSFKRGLPKNLVSHAQEVYDLVRYGMKLQEEFEEQLDEALTISQRRQRGLVMKRFKTKIAAARKRMARRMATTEKLVKRARRKAIRIIRKRVAGQKGVDYNELSPAEKIMIDKRVEKRKGAISKIAMRLLPSVRKDEINRLRSLTAGPSAKTEDVNAQFEAMLNEDTFEYEKPKTRRFHSMRNADGSIKLDKRFRAFKAKKLTELVDVVESLYDIATEITESVTLEEGKIETALKKKAEESGYSYKTLKTVFERGEKAWEETSAPKGDSNAQQWGFARVNSFIKGKNTDGDLTEMTASELQTYKTKMHSANTGRTIQKAIAMVKQAVDADKSKKHDPEDHAFEVLRQVNIPLTARELVKAYRTQYNIKEEHGAGEDGTDKLVKKYKKDTPGECDCDSCSKLNEEASSCSLIGKDQIKAFEKFVDRMFEKFNIDFEFTKHFTDRMSDERNKPCITLKELADLITKIYKKSGNPLKGKQGSEVVVKDIQSDLNMPIVVEYDPKKDEFEFTAKTIMRKKNFATTSPVVKY